MEREVTGGREIFIENIDRDEMRSGFLVTSHRKKLWNVQIGLIKEFDRICRKHKITYFAEGGTLLGAARHKGFIPWDDDVDFMMFRPDYEKFQAIAAQEVKPPYFLDIWWNYRLESEGASLDDSEGDFQFITLAQEKAYDPHRWYTQWPSIRLRDSRTTMLEFPERNFINQGIFIDIFSLDPLPPFEDKEHSLIFDTARILLLAAAAPLRLRELVFKNASPPPIVNFDNLEKFLGRTYRERGRLFENFMSKNFFMSERMGCIYDFCLCSGQHFYGSKNFNGIIYLPFEKIEVPAPPGYDTALKDYFGDWHKMIITHSHAAEYSADVSFEEYRKKSFRFNQAK